jgi:hypothetical protein
VALVALVVSMAVGVLGIVVATVQVKHAARQNDLGERVHALEQARRHDELMPQLDATFATITGQGPTVTIASSGPRDYDSVTVTIVEAPPIVAGLVTDAGAVAELDAGPLRLNGTLPIGLDLTPIAAGGTLRITATCHAAGASWDVPLMVVVPPGPATARSDPGPRRDHGLFEGHDRLDI